MNPEPQVYGEVTPSAASKKSGEDGPSIEKKVRISAYLQLLDPSTRQGISFKDHTHSHGL